MTIIFGKLLKKNFESDDKKYHVYWFRAHGGKCCTAIFRGENAPKPFKTIEYEFIGEWVTHPKYGKQFQINEYKRSSTQNTEEKNQSKILNDAVKKVGKKKK